MQETISCELQAAVNKITQINCYHHEVSSFKTDRHGIKDTTVVKYQKHSNKTLKYTGNKIYVQSML